MNNEPQLMMEELVKSIKASQEYNQYQNLLVTLKGQPEIYNRIAEFRRRSIALQMSEEGQSIEANNALQKDFADLQTNGLANEFMAAEHQYCHMIRKLQNYFLEHLDLETSFLEN